MLENFVLSFEYPILTPREIQRPKAERNIKNPLACAHTGRMLHCQTGRGKYILALTSIGPKWPSSRKLSPSDDLGDAVFRRRPREYNPDFVSTTHRLANSTRFSRKVFGSGGWRVLCQQFA